MTQPTEPTTPEQGTGTETPPPAETPNPAQGAGGTDWEAKYKELQAESRKWESRAKENKGAADELEKLRKAAMTEQEKAVEAAKAEGRTTAAQEYGAKLAAAQFEAACAKAGVDLGEAAEFIDVSRFVGDDGEVNTTAIKSAVTKFSNLTAKQAGPGRSGADLSGGSGEQAASLEKQIEEAKARRDHTAVIALKRQLAARGT